MLVAVMALNSRATSCASGVDGSLTVRPSTAVPIRKSSLKTSFRPVCWSACWKARAFEIRQAEDAGGGEGRESTTTEAGHQRTFPAAFSSTTFEITAVSTVSGRCEQKPMPT